MDCNKGAKTVSEFNPASSQKIRRRTGGRKAQSFALCLVMLAIVGVVHFMNRDVALMWGFSNVNVHDWRNAPFMLPAAAAIWVGVSLVGTKMRLKESRTDWMQIMFAISLQLWLSPNRYVWVGIVFGCLLFFYTQRMGSKVRILKGLFLAGAYLMCVAPTVLDFPRLSSPESFSLLALRMGLLVRLLSWSVEHHLYQTAGSDSLVNFLDYIFNPIFFYLPFTVIQINYNEFHRSKALELNDRFWYPILLITWSAICVLITTRLYRSGIFWTFDIPGRPLLSSFSRKGLFLVGLYFLHAGTSSFRAACAIPMGYRLVYDMNYPFLARSPFEFFGRFGFYMRQSAIRTYILPAYFFLTRLGARPQIGQYAAILVSVAFIGVQSIGYRGFYFMTAKYSLDRNAILLIFIIVYIFIIERRRPLSAQGVLTGLLGRHEEKLRKVRAVLGWSVTMLMLMYLLSPPSTRR